MGSGEVLEDLRVYRTKLGPASEGITDLGDDGDCLHIQDTRLSVSVRLSGIEVGGLYLLVLCKI